MCNERSFDPSTEEVFIFYFTDIDGQPKDGREGKRQKDVVDESLEHRC